MIALIVKVARDRAIRVAMSADMFGFERVGRVAWPVVVFLDRLLDDRRGRL